MAPETAYHYAVLARSANGEGTQSDIISATTPAAPKSKEQPRRSGARQDTPIPPVILVSNLSQIANQNATYSRDHGQAFTTGNNSTGYSVTSVSRDPNNDPIPLQICEVDGSVHPTTVCTDLTPPGSYPQGNLTYTVPTTTPLTLDADTTYSKCSDLRGSEQPAAFQEGIETSSPPGAKEGCQGHLAVGALP